ncbi:MAG TPA: Sir2 family NAD-dependent protein deacetylase [Kofleriaceae bacterium]|nr:Sir2 family NAD-dependent protein deacetylase [Kofleriaceae bacterium]
MRFTDYRHIVVLTGAGISRSAGLATYRGPGGLWSDPELAVLSHVDALATRRDDVCAMFWRFRSAIRGVEPTAAHRALAALPNATIITQNVDGLHQAAGSRDVIEYHGTLARWRCDGCGRSGEPPDAAAPPSCCGTVMRPDAVLFGEMIPADAEHRAKRALRDVDLFVAVGTSGTVAPAAGFVRSAEYVGARRVLINLEEHDDAHELFDEIHLGEADELVPRLFARS